MHVNILNSFAVYHCCLTICPESNTVSLKKICGILTVECRVFASPFCQGEQLHKYVCAYP